MSALSVLLAVVALGARVQVVVGDEDRELVAAQIELAEDQEIEWVEWGSLLERGPVLLGNGRLLECRAGQVDQVDFDGLLAEAEEAVLWGEERSLTLLAQGELLLRCVRQPIRADAAARLYFLSGVHVAYLDPNRARTAFRNALRFRPDLSWDHNFPPDGIEQLALAREDLVGAPPVPLKVFPPPASLTVDGRLALLPVVVNPGPHLVQTGGVTLEVQLPPGEDSALVVPAAYPGSARDWMDDPVRRDGLVALLDATLDPRADAWLVRGESRWRRVDGVWFRVAVPGFAEGDAIRLERSPERWMVAGAVGVGVGAVLAGGGWGAGRARYDDYGLLRAPGADDAGYDAVRAVHGGGLALSAAGEAALLTGVVLHLLDPPAPAVEP